VRWVTVVAAPDVVTVTVTASDFSLRIFPASRRESFSWTVAVLPAAAEKCPLVRVNAAFAMCRRLAVAEATVTLTVPWQAFAQCIESRKPLFAAVARCAPVKAIRETTGVVESGFGGVGLGVGVGVVLAAAGSMNSSSLGVSQGRCSRRRRAAR
jgi:hypothetical protein